MGRYMPVTSALEYKREPIDPEGEHWDAAPDWATMYPWTEPYQHEVKKDD